MAPLLRYAAVRVQSLTAAEVTLAMRGVGEARYAILMTVLGLSIGGAGCASLGGILPGGGGQVVGEVQYVDERYREIEVRTDRGDVERVEFDDRTTVYYGNEQYRVSALERGDLVAMDVEDVGSGRLYTQRIDVRQTAQDRGYDRIGAVRPPGPSDEPSGTYQPGGVQKLTGYVTRVDSDAGVFELRLADDGSVLVRLPDRPSDPMTSMFGRLRKGSHVRLRIEWVGDSEARLLEFV